MRRLFTRKSADDTKIGKEEAKDGKSRKSLFGKSHNSRKEEPATEPPKSQPQPTSQTTSQQANNTDSSASSTVSIPPAASCLPTPSGSSSSFSSVASCNDLSSPSSISTAPSTAPSSTLSRSPDSNASISSLNSVASPSRSLVVPSPSLTPGSRPQSSPTEQRKTLSPLSAVIDFRNHYTPPSSDDEDEILHPKRRSSIYNIFRKSQSQPNLNSGPPSRSSSTTTLPSAYNAPQGSGSVNLHPSTPNQRKSVNFLRRKPSNNSLEDVVDGDGILSRNEATARRAILLGDPLGGGAYLYPMGLASKSDIMQKPKPSPQTPRNRRGASGRKYDPKRSTWGGAGPQGGGGMAWRAPHIGGKNGGKMIIEEEIDILEQQHLREREITPGGFIEDTPQFEQPQNQRLRPPNNRRPTSSSSQSGRTNSSGYGYYNGNDSPRSGNYPPFALPPMLPVINQQSAQSAQA